MPPRARAKGSRDEGRGGRTAPEEVADEASQPWKNVFRPTCALPPKDNSFTLDDDAAVAAVETVLTCLCVADPGPEPAPGGSSAGLGVGVGVGGLGSLSGGVGVGVGVGLGPWPRQPEERQPLCFVSPGFLAMTGYSEQECLGRNCRFLQQPPPGSVAQGPGAPSASGAASGGGSGSPLLSSGPSSSALQQLLASAGSAGAHAAGGLSAGSSRPHSPSPSTGSPPPQGGAPGEVGGGPPSPLVALRSALAERRFGCAELTNYRKDGRPFQVLLGLVPVLDGDGGSLLQWVGCQCDLDERRHRGEPADEAFAAKWQEQVRHYLGAFALVDCSSPGVPLAAASPGLCALTGYRQADVVGWPLLCLCGPDTSERDMRRLVTAQRAHAPAAVRLLCYRRDGTPFWALVVNCPLTSKGQQQPPQQQHTPSQQGATRSASGAAGTASPARGHAAPTPMSRGTRSVGSGSQSSAQPHGAQGQGQGQGALGGQGQGQGQGVTRRYCLCVVVDVTASRLKRVGKYVLGKVIGAGAFGLVRVGKSTVTDELVAVKSVDATRFRSIAEIEQIQEEMAVLSSLRHPNIIRLLDVHFQSNTFFLVMEYAGGGSLVRFMAQHDRLRRCLDEDTAGRVFAQIVSALDYCHRRRVIHRDLKPENILLDERHNIKVADFGLAAVTAPFSGGLTLQCGTPEFTAPEITTGREYDGPSVDMWSMGVILYEALTGSLPFKGASTAALFKAIQRGVYEPLPASLSPEVRDLVRRMLAVEPVQRITMDELLRHPWVARAAAGAGAGGVGGGGSLAAGGAAGGAASPRSGGAPRPELLLEEGGQAHAALPSPAAGATGGSGSATPGSPFGVPGPGGQGGGAPWRGGQPSGPRVSDGSGMACVSASPASRPGSVSGYGAPVPSPSGAGAGPHGPGGGSGTGGGVPAADGGGGAAGGGGAGMQGTYPLPGGPSGSLGSGLHDSVKIVVTAPACGDRGDPILAAILRSTAVQAAMGGGAEAGDDDGGLRVQPSAHSYSHGGAGAGGRGGREGASGPSSRAPSRSLAGLPGSGSLHGHSHGKARGGALLPTLADRVNGSMDRRDPSRFRSPARGGASPLNVPSDRGAGGAGGAGARGSPVGASGSGPGGARGLHVQRDAGSGSGPQAASGHGGGSDGGLPPIQAHKKGHERTR